MNVYIYLYNTFTITGDAVRGRCGSGTRCMHARRTGRDERAWDVLGERVVCVERGERDARPLSESSGAEHVETGHHSNTCK